MYIYIYATKLTNEACLFTDIVVDIKPPIIRYLMCLRTKRTPEKKTGAMQIIFFLFVNGHMLELSTYASFYDFSI